MHEPRPLALEPMRLAAKELTGTHDFTSFCASGTAVENKTRTVFRIHIEEDGPLVHVYVFGDGFLYQMVRIMVGTLVEVGLGRRPPGSVADILAARDRRMAGITAPAKGLTLWEVYYDQESLRAALERFS
jgi:tRNA pseudouridine38-40 synthase